MSTKASGDTARAASVPAWIEPQLTTQQRAAELVDDFAGNAEQGRFDRHLRPTLSEEGNVTAPEPERLAETPDRYGAFPRLSEAQIEALTAQGYRRGTQPGEVLFREGDPRCNFFVVLAGRWLSWRATAGTRSLSASTAPAGSWASSICSPGRPSS